MKLLDLYCCAGGCTKGYQSAGFYVVGVDIDSQPHYCGDAFVQMDAIKALETLLAGGYITDTGGRNWYLSDFFAIHASPPCQRWSKTQKLQKNTHPELIEPTRKLLERTGKPYIIENVPGAPLINPVYLSGSMFGLMTLKPRLFECSFDLPFILAPPPHARQCKMGRKPKPGEYIQVVGNFTDVEYAKQAIGIDWMNRNELSQAVPPAYTEWIGKRLLEAMDVQL